MRSVLLLIAWGASCWAQSLAVSVAPAPPPSWNWIHAGVAAEIMGDGLDWATSWKQPEGNRLLAETGGEYSGRLYRVGSWRKGAAAAGIALVSYGVAWKWPKLRRYVGIFDLSLGATWAVVACSNVARNPYYR